MVNTSAPALIQPLNSENAQAFAHLATGFGKGRMTGNFERLIALGAWMEDEPAGLFLGAVSTKTSVLDVLTMRVAERYRRRGVGACLLAQGEEAARSGGCVGLRSLMADGSPDGPGAEALAVRAGWKRLRLVGNIYKVPYRLIGHSSWVSRAQPWPQGFEVFPWRHLTDTERTELLARRADGGSFAPTLDPLEQEADQTRNSVGLRVRGEVAGWAISWYLSSDPIDRRTMSRTKLFVRGDLQRRGYGAMLLAELIKRSPAADIDFGMFEISAANEFMLRLAEKRLRPYATGYRQIWEVGKDLKIERN